MAFSITNNAWYVCVWGTDFEILVFSLGVPSNYTTCLWMHDGSPAHVEATSCLLLWYLHCKCRGIPIILMAYVHVFIPEGYKRKKMSRSESWSIDQYSLDQARELKWCLQCGGAQRLIGLAQRIRGNVCQTPCSLPADILVTGCFEWINEPGLKCSRQTSRRLEFRR